MPPNQVRGPRPSQETRPAEGPTTDTQSTAWTAIERATAAYAVLVTTPAGKYRRRVFLSLHSATAAIQRAQAKGQPAELVLGKLVPVAADINLDGEVAS
jgi:hypothetical protein